MKIDCGKCGSIFTSPADFSAHSCAIGQQKPTP